MGVASKIGEISKEQGISIKELSRRVNVPYTTLYHAVKRDSKVELEIVKKIADVLDVPLTSLLGSTWGEAVAEDTLERMQKNGVTVYNPLEDEVFSQIRIPLNAHPRLKKSWRRLIEAFSCLNFDGQEVAADRVEELAQIPKYQSERIKANAETPPGSADDKEPEEK